MMSVFVDSTTLIYPLDLIEQDKATICARWLKIVKDSGTLVLAMQVLNETYWTVVRKPAFRAARPAIRDYVRAYRPYCTAPAQAPAIQDAAWDMQDRYGVQWWDALMLASANAAGCEYFLSEDLNDGQVYGGVTAINPFRHTPEDVLGRALPR
jgi:predicted nucleic acid-binding protein